MSELLRAAIFHTPGGVLEIQQDGALLVEDGRIAYCGEYKPFAGAKYVDLRGGFLLPGFIDTHIHFPQVKIIGKFGRNLLDWLEEFALPEEARMADADYAETIARKFVCSLAAHGTTTAMVFGSHFTAATAALFEQARTVRIFSGLVLSDRGLRPDLLITPGEAYVESSALIRRFANYVITPRFALSCSEAMLEVCQSLMDEHPSVRVQTHLNEQVQEIEEASRLFPWAKDYFGVYERFGLHRRAVMAHSVHSGDWELERMAASGVSVAHCPSSNAALGSGIFPFARHARAGIHCALGTDIGAGTGFGILKEALQAYLMQRIAPDPMRLDAGRMLYLATLAGAKALGIENETGSFENGKSADIVYLRAPENSALRAVLDGAESGEEALSALITMASAENIREVRVRGVVVHPELPISEA